MSRDDNNWLTVSRGTEPLVVSIPHSGTGILPAMDARLVSPWLARKDTDWWVDRLYDFATELGATVVRTRLSRTVIDVNRDPSGVSLYPGQNTTDLCPVTTFDGEPLYVAGQAPDASEITERRRQYFDPYHAALGAEVARLRAAHPAVVLYDAHSIRSHVPALFAGELPHINVGTNDGRSCARTLTTAIELACAQTGFTQVSNGRFKGGYITRHHGQPGDRLHAVQIELACRGYLREPATPLNTRNWPVDYDPACAAPLQAVLRRILTTCLTFAHAPD